MRLAEKSAAMDEAIRNLHIKISGCFNSCGQHHVADLGFYGVSRNKNGYTVPHFQVVLGGQWTENAGSYGLAIGAVLPSEFRRPWIALRPATSSNALTAESFQSFVKRIGKAECKRMLEDLTEVPPHDVDPSFYTDWADAREFTTGDMGVGECAGEVVSPIEFQLTACEREVFEAQVYLENGEVEKAARLAYESMLHGALALLRWRAVIFTEDPDQVVAAFRTHFYDTQLFYDPFAAGKFAYYFFRAHEHRNEEHNEETAHRLIEEAQLFIEACHSCYGRLIAKAVVA